MPKPPVWVLRGELDILQAVLHGAKKFLAVEGFFHDASTPNLWASRSTWSLKPVTRITREPFTSTQTIRHPQPAPAR
jgi:hypothetical protein